MNCREWKLGIILSPDGLEGIQVFNASPDDQGQILAVLPKLHRILERLGNEIMTATEENYGSENSYSC